MFDEEEMDLKCVPDPPFAYPSGLSAHLLSVSLCRWISHDFLLALTGSGSLSLDLVCCAVFCLLAACSLAGCWLHFRLTDYLTLSLPKPYTSPSSPHLSSLPLHLSTRSLTHSLTHTTALYDHHHSLLILTPLFTQ